MSSRIFLIAVLSSCALAQQAKPAVPKLDNDFVHNQFGTSCTLEPSFPPMTGDLNGDGIEDLVLVGRCKNPLIDQDEKNYRVIDPMDSFYGYGNPKVTSSMGQIDPRLKGIALLVIHGAGTDAWHAAIPGEKFVVINLEIKTVAVKKMKMGKKKSVSAIYVEESTADQMTSAIFWDGRKYKYEPMGSGAE